MVVAIIAILASFLLPALRQAREMAYTVGCMSKMRQLSMASHLYSTDFDGVVCSGYPKNNQPGEVMPVNAFRRMCPYLQIDHTYSWQFSPGAGGGDWRDHDKMYFTCPQMVIDYGGLERTNQIMHPASFGYRLNAYLCKISNEWNPIVAERPLRLSEFPNPSKKLQFADQVGGQIIFSKFWFYIGGDGYGLMGYGRHPGMTVNVLFLDGHVQQLGDDVLPTVQNFNTTYKWLRHDYPPPDTL